MRSPVPIDFAPIKPGLPLTFLAAFLLAAAACLAAFADYRSAAAQVDELAGQRETAQRRLERLRHPHAGAGRLELAPERVAAANRAIDQLNLPWNDLFEIFETRTLPSVALLALEPDGRKGMIRVTAEARTADGMADFLQLLAAEPRLAEVFLTKYEINEQDLNRPVRFVLAARWRREP